MNLPAVLVTDGHLRSSLSVVRSLGRAGYRVYVCGTHTHSLAGASRFVHAQTRVPDPLAWPREFAEAVIRLTRDWKIGVLLPMSEEALLALLPETNRMPGVIVPFPPLETFKRVADKSDVTEVAQAMGIAVPEQVVLRGRSGADLASVEQLTFPLVVKPARSVSGEGPDRAKMAITYVADRTEFDALIATFPLSGFPLLVQRRIRGPGTGVFLLPWNGKLIAQFAHRRIREKPPSGGVSVCAESIAVEPCIVEQSRALLAAFDWSGPAMVEYKQDQATGRLYLMEINGRFWGSLQLAVDAGVDFPALLVASALGACPAPVTSYTIGVQTHWWWGEVDHLISRLRAKNPAPGLGSRTQALKQFLSPGRGVRNEVFRRDDPMPFVRETMNWLRHR